MGYVWFEPAQKRTAPLTQSLLPTYLQSAAAKTRVPPVMTAHFYPRLNFRHAPLFGPTLLCHARDRNTANADPAGCYICAVDSNPAECAHRATQATQLTSTKVGLCQKLGCFLSVCLTDLHLTQHWPGAVLITNHPASSWHWARTTCPPLLDSIGHYNLWGTLTREVQLQYHVAERRWSVLAGLPATCCYDGALSLSWCREGCVVPKSPAVYTRVRNTMLVDRDKITARASFEFHHTTIVAAATAAVAVAR